MTDDQMIFVNKVEHVLRDLGAKIISFECKNVLPTWDFSFIGEGMEWPLRIQTYGWNIHELPAIYWRVKTPIWGWPHISLSGDVCISDREGLEYNPEDILGVLDWLLHKAVRMLAQNHSMPEIARKELFADELEGYLRNCGAKAVAIDEPLDTSKALYAEVEQVKKGKMNLVYPVVRRINQGDTQLTNCQQQRLGLVDLSIHQLPDLRSEWGVVWWNSFIERLSTSQRDIATSAKYRGLLLRVPNEYGYALFLLYWGVRPSKKGAIYFLQRQDRDYLIQRTGGEPLPRHAIVVGCGSVGSRVAEHLALSGIEKLTLVDGETFSADNLGRHILGKQSISKPKVDELAQLFRERMPGIDVESKAMHVQPLLAKGALATADAIVLATGNSVLERSIVRRAFQEGWPSLIVSTSVEAGGLGGHAIAMRPGVRGCLDCLYIDPDTQQPLAGLRTALIAPDQRITRQLTGCGAFTPYSSIDATRTALMAAERVLANTPVYSRWAGEGTLAKAESIQPSDTYHALRAGRIAADLDSSVFAQPRCPCCGV
ncbi:ThiF family adenylyltransferase [Pseudomonas baltica]|uniref:ThiF family adenylyltransferase n=1 Tax=Pseudomonas baltica TaxID=2762576 RepID=UPI0028A164B9|nr:ThiF family adenylyltransferase [Pseudomonas baltica]